MTYLPGSLYNFQTVTSTPTPLTVANRVAYVCKGTSPLTFQLPASTLAGFSFKVIGVSCLWMIMQNALQSITFGNGVTSTGVTGSLKSTVLTDKIEVTCFTANFAYDVTESFGNIQIT
jgi:hypothetical protein